MTNQAGQGDVNVYLYSGAGQPSIASSTLVGTASAAAIYPDRSQLTLVNLLAPGLVLLSANQTYDLILQPANAMTRAGWNVNNTGSTDIVWASSNSGATFFSIGTTTLPAFEVDVSSVPEPATWQVAFLGGLGLVAMHRRRFGRKQQF